MKERDAHTSEWEPLSESRACVVVSHTDSSNSPLGYSSAIYSEEPWCILPAVLFILNVASVFRYGYQDEQKMRMQLADRL